MPDMPDVPDLAARVRKRMTQRKYMTNAALAQAAGISLQGLAPILRGERRAYQRRMTEPLCLALGWTPDSIDSILAGGEPTELPVEVTQPDEELRVAIQELGATVASLAARHETSAAANDELTRRAEVERLEIDSALARLADRVAALEQRLAE